MQNLNSKYIEDFNSALDIYQNNYSHSDLIEYIKNGSVAQKQAAVIKLDNLKNKSDAYILMQNLTGCDGKIREAVSFRLPEFIEQNPEFFFEYDDIFLEAIIDINGNICRNIISSLKFLKKDKNFTSKFSEKLCQKAHPLALKINEFDIQEGKYKINKEVFKLYWYLETIYHIIEFVDKNSLFKLLNETKNAPDYTIREKTAKILSKIENNEKLINIKQELQQDQNYYVRRI